MPSSKAAPPKRAGGKPGKTFHRCSGKPVSGPSEWPRIVGNTKPGNKASMEVWRRGVPREIPVPVGELPEDRPASRTERRGKPPEQAANRLGFAVVDLPAGQKPDRNLRGAVIVSATLNNPRAHL